MTEYLKIDPVEELINAVRLVHGRDADAIIFRALVEAQVKLVKVTNIGVPQDAPQPILPPRDSVDHELKSWPKFFQAVWDVDKKFEIRNNDRNFQVGDCLFLREYDPDAKANAYSGRELYLRVTYLMYLSNWLKDQCIDWINGSSNANIVIMSFRIEKWRRPDDSSN
jgi:hypothetical protein